MPAKPSVQAVGICHKRVGDLVVTAINDGYLDGSLDLVTQVSKDEAAAAQRASCRSIPPRLTINAFLVQADGGRPILIDTGAGTNFGPSGGKLAEGLKLAGVEPAEIGTVLITHAHPDHTGGLAAGGSAVFSNAELVLGQAEADHWLADGALERAPEGARPYFQGAQAAIAPYKGRLRTVSSGEVVPGVTAVAAPGHTPGHTAYRIDSAGQSLLIWGDIVHLPGIQFALPGAGVVFDVDGKQAVETRRRMFDMAASSELTVAGMHGEFPAFGRVVRDGQAYRFLPDSWVSEI